MPGSPTQLNQGLIRSTELIETLRCDIDEAYQALETSRESQYLRRCVVRAVFSFIEAVVEVIKIETRKSIRHDEYRLPLSENEADLLGGTHLVPPPVGSFIPLDSNIKRTFRLAAKVWGIDFKLKTDGEEFRSLRTAKNARNRLTHPRTLYDVEVTDDDMHCHTVAGMWVQSEFQRLMKARIESLTKDFPEWARVGLASVLQDLQVTKK